MARAIACRTSAFARAGLRVPSVSARVRPQVKNGAATSFRPAAFTVAAVVGETPAKSTWPVVTADETALGSPITLTTTLSNCWASGLKYFLLRTKVYEEPETESDAE